MVLDRSLLLLQTFQLVDFIMSDEEVWLLGNKPQNEVVLHGKFYREPLTESEMMVKAPPEVYRPHRVGIQVCVGVCRCGCGLVVGYGWVGGWLWV